MDGINMVIFEVVDSIQSCNVIQFNDLRYIQYLTGLTPVSPTAYDDYIMFD